MIRFLTPLCAVLLVAGSVPAADTKKLTLRWHGQSFFDLETSAGARIVFDPHAIEAYGRTEVTADLILISHFHDDHTQVGVVQVNKNDKIKKPIIAGLKPVSRTKTEWEAIDEKLSIKGQEIRIRTVGTYHDTMQGMERGKNAVFIIDVDGLRIVHLGDLGHRLHPSTLKKIGKVDVLMVPVGGTYTINGSEAKEVVAQIKPRRYIIPMHYGTAAYRHLVGPDEFLDEQDPKLVKRFKTNELIIDADAVPRKDPVIALLSYEPAEDKSKPKDKDK